MPLPEAQAAEVSTEVTDVLTRFRLDRPLWEQRHRLATLQVHQDCAVGLAFAQGEIVHAKDGGGEERRGGLPTQQAEQGIAAHHQSPLVAEMHPGLAPQRHTKGHEALSEPQRAPGPGGGYGGQAFREDTTRTGAIVAKSLADAQLEGHPILRPRQVRQGAPIVTMDAPR